MVEIELTKKDIPYWLGGAGKLKISSGSLSLAAPLSKMQQRIFTVNFGETGESDFIFGTESTAKLKIKAGSAAALIVISENSDFEYQNWANYYGLDNYFSENPGDLILLLTLGSGSDVISPATTQADFLDTPINVITENCGSYTYLRGFAGDTSIEKAIKAFFAGLRLPGHIITSPRLGEMIRYDYDGLLKFGLGASTNYQIKLSTEMKIPPPLFSESDCLSLPGKLAIEVALDGQFLIETREAETPGWVRVVIRKRPAQDSPAATAAKTRVSIRCQNLPDVKEPPIEMLLEINVKTWLLRAEKLRYEADFNPITKKHNHLVENFSGAIMGIGVSTISGTAAIYLRQKMIEVINGTRYLEKCSIALLERYWDQLELLSENLREIINLTSWSRLKGEGDATNWMIVSYLTDGDPLNWMLGEINVYEQTIASLPELKRRAEQTLRLIQDPGYQPLRDFVKLAKEQFSLRSILTEIGEIDSATKLRQQSNTSTSAFIEGLMGKCICEFNDHELSTVFDNLKELINSMDGFEKYLCEKFKESVRQSVSQDVVTEYNHANEQDALIDLCLNLSTAEGKLLMRSIGEGNLTNVSAAIRPNLVRLNYGLFTHRVTPQNRFVLNASNWYSGLKEKWPGLEKGIFNTESRLNY